MDINKIKEVLKRIPPGISVGIPPISFDFGTISNYLSQLGSEEKNELLTALIEIKKLSEDQLKTLREELQDIGISNKEQIGQIVGLLKENIERQKSKILKSCFLEVDDAFEVQINKNFLLEFGGPNTDYLQLLAEDVRKLFFKFFNECNRTNEYNRICITGREGVGKTFSSLLIGKKLKQEGHSVYYCEDIRDASLSKAIFPEIMDFFDEHFVFIIDNCQADETKLEKIVATITKAEGYARKPRFIFLTRPLDPDEMGDIFGKNTPILGFREKWVNFEYLTALFFKKINLSEKLDDFLSSLEQYDLSKALFKYRNMAFWNEFFRSMEDSREIRIEERKFYERANGFLRRHEPYLIQEKDVLVKLLPFFMNGIPIHRGYVRDCLQIQDAQIQKLEKEKVIFLAERDWDNKNLENDTAMFVVSKIHPTKAKIIGTLLKKYEAMEIDISSAITDYAEAYYENLYYIITPFYELEVLEELCNNDKFVSVVKRYLRERHLGKQLDRAIRTFSKLEPQEKDKLIDDEIISAFTEKLNDKKPYIVSKLYLFRAIYKFSHHKTYELYQGFDTKVFIDDFNSIPGETGIVSFAKFMEIFKNIYYFADNKEEKAGVINKVKEILDGCCEEFVRRFEKRDIFFTQFHWLLQRLHRMKLGNYFLGKIPPARVVEWIRTKDTNIIELSKILLKDARYTSYVENDGTKKSYYDYFKNSLHYGDIKRIFDNKRSGLYDMVINSDNQMVANHLYRYSSEDAFIEKVSNESTYLINTSIGLLGKNIYLSDEQKNFIIDRIKDISSKKERFSNLKSKYGGDFA